MDISRPDLQKKNRRKRLLGATMSFVIIALLLVFLWSYDPGPHQVEKELVWIGKVEKGPMLRNVRGVGVLVPAEIRWVAARTSGRIERIHVLPGAWVESDSVIMELSNPELVQQTQSARLQLKSDQARFVSEKVELQSNQLQLESGIAQIESDAKLAQLESDINTELFNEGLETELNMKRSQLRAEQLKNRLELERKRLAFREEAIESQVFAKQSLVEQTEDRLTLLKEQLDGLTVRAGFAGVLQKQTVQEGQQVGPGHNLSQVANPNSLKAVIRISEHQAKDVMIGQIGEIDTRNGVVQAKVIRVDPNVENGTVAVDMELIGKLPKGARPDLTVEGTIELERIKETIYVDRPVYSRADSIGSIFCFDENSQIARRISVKFGRTSVNTIEVLEGLKPGQKIILSDTSDWDEQNLIQVK